MKFFRPSVIVGTLPVTLLNGTTADATQVMSDFNWVVNQVNANAVPLASAALTNANNNFTVIQSGVSATQPANFPIASQIQGDVFNTFQSTLGTNAITARMSALALTAWPTDAVFSFIPSQTNTGPANITVDSAGSSIIFSMGSTLVGGELRAGVPAIVKRDATKLNLVNSSNVRFDLASATSSSSVRMLISSGPRPITLAHQPTVTTIASGSGTYNSPATCTRLWIRLIGAGGGGGGSNSGGSAGGNGGNGGDTTFETLTAGGGSPGSGAAGPGGAGGTASGGSILNLSGGSGGSGTGVTGDSAGDGANSVFGGGGGGVTSGNTAVAGATNTGGGGGGAAGGNASKGGGGGAGGYVEHMIFYPDASYSFSVGTAGTAGAAGTGGANGATGGSGVIVIMEFYN